MTISEYIRSINKRYKTGISREHAYRGDLQNLLEGMLKNVLVTNKPARIACGAPDFILTHKDIPVGYMEAKDIGEPLTGSKYKEQFNRYKESQSPSSDEATVTGKVQINDEQYFGNVPLKAWEFHIGGYQPAKKWLKDRRDRTLSMEEIQHYQKIIVALMETDRIMEEIDGVFEITDK